MEDRQEDILKQYDISIKNKYRVKGTIVLETNRGTKLLRGYNGSPSRLPFVNCVMRHMKENGYANVDEILPNREGELLSLDSSGNRFYIKDWYDGEEISLRNREGSSEAVQNLASVHKAMQGIQMEEGLVFDNGNLSVLFDKHNREMKRVRSYIRDKKVRNEFEVSILNSFEIFYDQGKAASQGLLNCKYEELHQKAVDERRLLHGDYTYHNVCKMQSGMATINFEHCGIGLPLFDLYYLLRKTMEKNEWNIALGMDLIEEYDKILTLSNAEQNLLYVLLCYPEKYWKILNYYYNSKKSWVSMRNIEKLEGVKEQQKKKDEFLKALEVQVATKL